MPAPALTPTRLLLHLSPPLHREIEGVDIAANDHSLKTTGWRSSQPPGHPPTEGRSWIGCTTGTFPTSNHPRAPQPCSSGAAHTRCMKSLDLAVRGHTRPWTVVWQRASSLGQGLWPLWPFWSGFTVRQGQGPGASEHTVGTGGGYGPLGCMLHQLLTITSCHIGVPCGPATRPPSCGGLAPQLVSCMWCHVMSHTVCIVRLVVISVIANLHTGIFRNEPLPERFLQMPTWAPAQGPAWATMNTKAEWEWGGRLKTWPPGADDNAASAGLGAPISGPPHPISLYPYWGASCSCHRLL